MLYHDPRIRGLDAVVLMEGIEHIDPERHPAVEVDGSIEKLPTDFVGMILKSVDLENECTVRDRVKDWLKDDLRIGRL